jgi:hypothetical protein
MKTYKKNYIGKGTQVPNMSIAKCTVKVSEMMKFIHEYEGEDYITFEVAKMQNSDKFGRDYTVYCTIREEVEYEKPAPKKRKTKKAENADIPF